MALPDSSLKAAPINVRYETADPVALSFPTKASVVAVEARVELEPGQEWQTCGELIFEHGQQVMEPAYGHRTSEQLVEPLSELDELQERWSRHALGATVTPTRIASEAP